MLPALPLFLALAQGAEAQKPAAAANEKKAQAQVQLIFSHAPHQGLVECLDCHVGIEKSKSLEERHVPGVAKCQECHDDKAPPVRAAGAARLTFSHADHLTKVKNECNACHKSLPEPAAGPEAPPMSACTACHYHAKEFAEARCAPCHIDLRRYAQKPATAFSHSGDFLRTHGPMARSGVQACMVCHDQTKCAECHSATTRPFKSELLFPEQVEAQLIHRGDFVSRHTIEAKADPASCRRCHGSAFCESCHREQNVSPALSNPRSPHPPSQQWIPQHGREARANIISCAACHDQGSRAVCVQCHRTGGVNPHPPGWTSRHATADVAGNKMCRICHQ